MNEKQKRAGSRKNGKRNIKKAHAAREASAIKKAFGSSQAALAAKRRKIQIRGMLRTCFDVACGCCNKVRPVELSALSSGRGKYCSHKCSLSANMKYPKGSSHHNWNGGRKASGVRYNRNNKSKNHCRAITRGMIGLGWIDKQPCEVCGDPKSQTHHEDYENPFLVKFLCKKHHLEAHGGSFFNGQSEALLRATNLWKE